MDWLHLANPRTALPNPGILSPKDFPSSSPSTAVSSSSSPLRRLFCCITNSGSEAIELLQQHLTHSHSMYSLRSPAATILRQTTRRAATTSKPSNSFKHSFQRATYAYKMDRSAGPPLTNPLNIPKWCAPLAYTYVKSPTDTILTVGSKPTPTSSNPPSTTT